MFRSRRLAPRRLQSRTAYLLNEQRLIENERDSVDVEGEYVEAVDIEQPLQACHDAGQPEFRYFGDRGGRGVR